MNLFPKTAKLARLHKIELPQIDAPLDELDVRSLTRARHATFRTASAVMRQLQKADNDNEVRDLGDAHDELMAAVDQIDDALSRAAEAEDDARLARRPVGDNITVNAHTGEQTVRHSGWVDSKGNEVRVLKPNQRLEERGYRGPELGTILRAMLYGPRNDAEARALAEGTDSAGGYTVPVPLASRFIDGLRTQSVVMRAGAMTVDLTSETLSIARLETDPTVSWVAENASISDSSPTFGRVQLTAKKLIGLVKTSRELMEDSLNLGRILETAFANAMALEVDRACLFGSGSGAEPTGIVNMANIAEVSMGANGAALTNYDTVLDTLYQLQLANAGPATAMIWHPRTGLALAKLKDGDNNPLRVPEMVAEVPKLATTSVPIDETQGTAENASSIITGNFEHLLVGYRSQMRIELLRERYADNYQYGFLCALRMDVQAEHEEGFAVLKGIIPAS